MSLYLRQGKTSVASSPSALHFTLEKERKLERAHQDLCTYTTYVILYTEISFRAYALVSAVFVFRFMKKTSLRKSTETF